MGASGGTAGETKGPEGGTEDPRRSSRLKTATRRSASAQISRRAAILSSSRARSCSVFSSMSASSWRTSS
ncbi:MAG: hypothetical protein LBD09_03965 [Treponema sp.]|nr:hypothetical protein [Treponema sp.]